MDKIKLLTISVATLLILNLGIVAFLIINKPGGMGRDNRRANPEEYIVNQLHFNAQQQQEFKALIRIHRNKIDAIDDKIRENKNVLYRQLIQPNCDSKTNDSLILVLTACQKEIETTHFKHFQDIKKLCKKNQLNDFNELTISLSKFFYKSPRPRND